MGIDMTKQTDKTVVENTAFLDSINNPNTDEKTKINLPYFSSRNIIIINNNKFLSEKVPLPNCFEEKNNLNSSVFTQSKVVLRRRSKTLVLKCRLLVQEKQDRRTRFPRQTRVIHMSPTVFSIIEVWNDLGFRRHREGSKTLKRGVDFINALLQGKFFNDFSLFKKYHRRCFSSQEIIRSINRFALMAFDPQHEPLSEKAKLSFRNYDLPSFFYSKFWGDSMFIKCYENEPRRVRPVLSMVPDTQPSLTNLLSKYYVKLVHEYSGNGVDLSDSDQNNFKKASTRLAKFYETNKEKLNPYWIPSVLELGTILCEAIRYSIEEQFDGDISKLSPGWFSSDTTFDSRLPQYLRKEDLWIKPASPLSQTYRQTDNR